jgi:hypothetical protein
MNYSECPNCERLVNVGKHPRIGQYVLCHSCDTKLEIYSIDPIEMDWVPVTMKHVRHNRVRSNDGDEFE